MKIKEGYGTVREKRDVEPEGGGGLAWPEQMKPVQRARYRNSTTFLLSCPAETRRFTQDNFHVTTVIQPWPPRWW